MTESARFFRSTFPDTGTDGFRSALWKFGVPGSDEPVTPLYPTLIAALDGAAANAAKGVGVTLLPENEEEPEERMSYAALRKEALRVAALLAGRGISRGDCVLMVLPTSFDFLVSFYALLYLGAVPVPSYPPAMMEKAAVALDRLGHIAEHAQVAGCISNAQLVPILGSLASRAPKLREIIAVDKLREERSVPALPELAEIKPSTTAFIQYTSGSTGNPKGVRLTHGAVCTNIHTIGQGMHISRKDVGVSWLPLYHDMGLVGGFLMPLFFRLPMVLMAPTTFLLRPSRWLWAITKHRCTMIVSPNFGYALCVKRVRPSEREGLDLSSLRVCLNGAEPVNYRTVVDFERAYTPYGYDPKAMYPVYGQAESVVAITFPTPGEPVRVEIVDRKELANGRVINATGTGTTAIVGVGRSLPGHRVIVVDAEGREVPEATVGHVVVRGPSVMKGYYRDAESTERVLRGGWLWTGDLGFVKGGSLFITGRAKDLIIVRGHNFYPEDIERVAERIPGVRPGGTAGFGVYDEDKAQDLVVLVVETRVTDVEEQKQLVDEIQQRVANHCGLKLDEVVLVPPGTIPKTSSGKRQRALTRERYLGRELLAAGSKPSKLAIAAVFARSGAGLLKLFTRKITTRRRAPE